MKLFLVLILLPISAYSSTLLNIDINNSSSSKFYWITSETDGYGIPVETGYLLPFTEIDVSYQDKIYIEKGMKNCEVHRSWSNHEYTHGKTVEKVIANITDNYTNLDLSCMDKKYLTESLMTPILLVGSSLKISGSVVNIPIYVKALGLINTFGWVDPFYNLFVNNNVVLNSAGNEGLDLSNIKNKVIKNCIDLYLQLDELAEMAELLDCSEPVHPTFRGWFFVGAAHKNDDKLYSNYPGSDQTLQRRYFAIDAFELGQKRLSTSLAASYASARMMQALECHNSDLDTVMKLFFDSIDSSFESYSSHKHGLGIFDSRSFMMKVSHAYSCSIN